MKLRSWIAIGAFSLSAIGGMLIAATSYLTDGGNSLPPWF